MPLKCIDHLALAHKKYPRKMVAELHPKGWGIGLFDTVFGPAVPAIHEFMEHVRWAPKACKIHMDFSYGHFLSSVPHVKKCCKNYKPLFAAYPNTKFILSHSCEYNSINRVEIMKRVMVIQDMCPDAIVINTPSGMGAVLEDVPTEIHGDPARYWESVSFDGLDMTSVNVKEWLRQHRHANYLWAWRSEFNMRNKGDSRPPPPKKRTRIPTKQEVQEAIRLMKG